MPDTTRAKKTTLHRYTSCVGHNEGSEILDGRSSLCVTDQLKPTPAKKPFSCETWKRRTSTERDSFPRFPLSNSEGWWEECFHFIFGKCQWCMLSNCSIWKPVKREREREGESERERERKHAWLAISPQQGEVGKLDEGGKIPPRITLNNLLRVSDGCGMEWVQLLLALGNPAVTLLPSGLITVSPSQKL